MSVGGKEMNRKLVQVLAMALVAVFVMSAGAFAASKTSAVKSASQMLNGTVEALDMQHTMVTVKTTNGQMMHLKATKSQLAPLHVGDRVKATVSGESVTAIHKDIS
jgi:hypothetical protein